MTTQGVFRVPLKTAYALVAAACVLLALTMAAPAQAQSPAAAGDRPERTADAPAMSLRRVWAPPDIDAETPPVQPGVPCPLDNVLKGVGDRLQELVDNLQQFSAQEQIENVEVDKKGRPSTPETADFAYVVEIHPSPTGIEIREYRNGSNADTFQGGLATAGTAGHALILHPSLIGDYNVTCEGLGEMDGQQAWQLHFAQRPDRPPRFRTYRTQHAAYQVALKGRAWIAADTYQLLRMETDLIKPVPEIRLLRDHVIVDYRPVDFRKHGVQLWLPQTADIYIDLLGHRVHRRHTFSDFQLFWVDVKHKEEARDH